MYRVVTICLAIISLREAAIVPVPENTGNGQSKQRVAEGEPIYSASEIGNQPQSYRSTRGNQLTTSQYFYPTYPGYEKNGYEGYLVPSSFSTQRDSHWVSDVAMTLLPFSTELLLYGSRAGVYLFQFLLAVLVGGAFTTILCTFTPICSITFPGLGFTKNQVKEQVAELARTYVTAENVNAATVLVSAAIDKYAAMQREKQQKPRNTTNTSER